MRQLLSILLFSAALFLAQACKDGPKAPEDTLSTGTITISADESYKPVIDEELRVFDSSYPNAHITVQYKPESECIQDYLSGKVRLILVTRDLSADEKKYCEDKKIVPQSMVVASDAVAVIVNNNAADTLLALSQVKGILTGIYSHKYTAVFDNSGSSTLRFLQDSILQGDKFGANVFAAKSNDSVVDYVSKNQNAIGFVGFSYVNAGNTGEQNWTDKVRVLAIQDPKTNNFYKPYQAFIATRSYPLTRDLLYVKNETWPGLGTGFANFLAGERGQLIFKTALFFPRRSNIVIKDAIITDNPVQ